MPKRKVRSPPKIGAVFEKAYHEKIYTLTVVSEGQRIGFKVGKTIYPSPTAAAKAIVKSEVNGWRFWDMDR